MENCKILTLDSTSEFFYPKSLPYTLPRNEVYFRDNISQKGDIKELNEKKSIFSFFFCVLYFLLILSKTKTVQPKMYPGRLYTLLHVYHFIYILWKCIYRIMYSMI
jgi:hypothetical protein